MSPPKKEFKKISKSPGKSSRMLHVVLVKQNYIVARDRFKFCVNVKN